LPYGSGRSLRLAPALTSWLFCISAALLTLAPLAAESGAHVFGESGEASLYDNHQALAPIRPETALRVEVRSLKLALPAADALHIARSVVPDESRRHTRADLLSEAAADCRPPPAYASRAPPTPHLRVAGEASGRPTTPSAAAAGRTSPNFL